jgi:hypothetical protein
MILEFEKKQWARLLESARINIAFNGGKRRGLSSKKLRVQKRIVRQYIKYLLTKLFLEDGVV